MSGREKILAAVKAAQPEFVALPDLNSLPGGRDASVEKFISSLQSIGGHAKAVSDFEEIKSAIRYQFPGVKRTVSTFNELREIAEVYCDGDTINKPEEIDVAILRAHFGVAENGAVWMSENKMCDRALPFICQHLVVVVHATTILPDMHSAYDEISNDDYGFAIFIAGPSKTADIEQSLVLGAHGPVSMTALVLQ
jgi:L-lactate dehydrogenase complex protein LldG